MHTSFSNLRPFDNSESAGRVTLAYLHQRLGFRLWMIGRKEGEDWIVLQTEDHGYDVKEGTVFRWVDTLCSHMAAGFGPRIAPSINKVPVYSQAKISRQLTINAYIGVPIAKEDGTLLGTLCAIDPEEQPASIIDHLPMIELLAQMLATIFASDLRAVEQARIAEQAQQAEEKLKKRAHDLGERVKELSCLYGIDEIGREEELTIEQILEKTVVLIPLSWQYTEITEGRITFEGKEFRTKNFKKTKWRQTSDIVIDRRKVGSIEICYLKAMSEDYEGPFLREERNLIDSIAIRLSGLIQRKRAEAQIRDEKDFTETALDAQLDTFFLFEPATGKALRWNRVFRETSGYTDEEISRMTAPESYYSPGDLERADVFMQKVLKEGTGTIELELICKDGHKVPTEYQVAVIKDDRGESKYIVSIGRDITERKRNEEALRIKDLAIHTSMSGVAFADLEGNLTYANNAFLEMWGYDTEEEVIGKPSVEFWKTEENAEMVIEALKKYGGWRGEMPAKRKDGSIFETELSASIIKDKNGRMIGMMGSFADITERKRVERALRESEKRLQQLSITDSLTGLLNSRGWEECMATEESRAKRYSHQSCVIVLDLNDLKKTNDKYGHKAGDDLIHRAALCIQGAVRDIDRVARIGGDEFAVLVIECSEDAVNGIITRIKEALSAERISASWGMAIRNSNSGLAGAMAEADRQMYEMKTERQTKSSNERS